MSLSHFHIIAISTISVFSLNCGNVNPPEQEGPSKKVVSEKPRLAGRVAAKPKGGSFVLVELYGEKEFKTGSIFLTYGSERKANLRLTGECLGRYAAADIRSGTVEIGDAVYFNLASVTNDKESLPNTP